MLNEVVLIVGVFFALYIMVCLGLYLAQTKLLFPGETLAKSFSFRKLTGLSEVSIPTAEGVISALHFRNDSPKGLIFFLHGNRGNLDLWVPDVDFYRQESFDLFMVDYRGYGKSDGEIISEQQVVDDVLAAWESIAPGYRNSGIPVMIYGRSIGSFFAAKLANMVAHEVLVLVSPFSSMQKLVREKMPWLPRFLLRFEMSIESILASNTAPVYLLHGTRDALIPIDHAHRLASLSENIELKAIDGAAHGDIHDNFGYQNTMSQIARSIAH